MVNDHFAHSEVDSDSVMLANDPVSDVIKQTTD